MYSSGWENINYILPLLYSTNIQETGVDRQQRTPLQSNEQCVCYSQPYSTILNFLPRYYSGFENIPQLEFNIFMQNVHVECSWNITQTPLASIFSVKVARTYLGI